MLLDCEKDENKQIEDWSILKKQMDKMTVEQMLFTPNGIEPSDVRTKDDFLTMFVSWSNGWKVVSMFDTLNLGSMTSHLTQAPA